MGKASATGIEVGFLFRVSVSLLIGMLSTSNDINFCQFNVLCKVV